MTFAKNVKLQKILMKRVTRLGIKHTVAMAHRRHAQRDTFLFKRRPNKNFFRSFFTLVLIIIVGYLVITSESEKHENEMLTDSVESGTPESIIFMQKLDSLGETHFRFPVGDSVGKGYIVARKFNQYFERNLLRELCN